MDHHRLPRVRSANSALSLARSTFGKVHGRPSDVVHVIRKNVQHNIGNGLDNVSVGQASDARLLEIAVANFTALHYNGASKLQNSVGLFDRGLSMASPGNLIFGETKFAAHECVRG